MWSKFTPEEIERRRLESVEAMKERDRAEWYAWYQEQCDRMYWARGKCCAGCDHWSSDGGMTGNCLAAGIVSGSDVIRSLGFTFCSYTPPPGHPFSRAESYCGKFEDKFDWSTLDADYLARIGATQFGELKNKPQSVAST